MKLSGDNNMLWAFISSVGTKKQVRFEVKLNGSIFTAILEKSSGLMVIFQKDNHPKHPAKAT